MARRRRSGYGPFSRCLCSLRAIFRVGKFSLNYPEDVANTSKPVTLHPMKFEDAVSALLKAKPIGKQPKARKLALKGSVKPSPYRVA